MGPCRGVDWPVVEVEKREDPECLGLFLELMLQGGCEAGRDPMRDRTNCEAAPPEMCIQSKMIN